MAARRKPRPDPLERVRKICLALPEATEKEAWGSPTFRVRDKLFAHMRLDVGGPDREELAELVEDGDQMNASKRQLALLGTSD